MNRKVRRLLCALLIGAMLAALCGCASSEEREAYNLGKAALSAGRLADAAEYFSAAGSWKNSDEYLLTIYFEAMNCFEAGEHQTAWEVFRILEPLGIEESGVYAAAAGAYAQLEQLDGAGARESLIGADPTHEAVIAAEAVLDQCLFADTVLIRPEYVVKELRSGEIVPEVSNLSQYDFRDDILYATTRKEAEVIYEQYREYCMAAFPDTFRDESGNYFSIILGDSTFYISNFYNVDGGVVVLIPKY